MAKSMTGFGRSVLPSDQGIFIIEIQSVNRKNLDFSLSLPKELISLEIPIRKHIAKRIKRGYVTLRITKDQQIEQLENILPQKEVLRSFLAYCMKNSETLQLPSKDLTFPFLYEQIMRLGISSKNDDFKKLQEPLFSSLDEALKMMVEMKKKEGEEIQRELLVYLDTIEQVLNKIETLSTSAPEIYRKKLMQKLEEIQELTEEDQERVVREAVIYADRIDITEELLRMRSHLKQFHSTLTTEGDTMGKSLEFILQEMHREINTMGVKNPLAEVSREIFQVKSEIEKLKEQVFNIE